MAQEGENPGPCLHIHDKHILLGGDHDQRHIQGMLIFGKSLRGRSMTVPPVNLLGGHLVPRDPVKLAQGFDRSEEVPVRPPMGLVLQTPKQASSRMSRDGDPIVLPSDTEEGQQHGYRQDGSTQRMTQLFEGENLVKTSGEKLREGDAGKTEELQQEGGESEPASSRHGRMCKQR